MKYTICVDFDGVIHSYTTPWIKPHIIPDPPVEGAIQWLFQMVQHFEVVILSTRCETWRGRRAMRQWLRKQAVCGRDANPKYFDRWPTLTAVPDDKDDEDLIIRGLVTIRFSYTKPPALIYLDDRAVRFEGPGTFPSRDEIHRRYIPWNRLAPPIGEIL